MVDRAAITQKIDAGRGKAAEKLGYQFDVYRLSASSSGNVIVPGNKIQSNLVAFPKIASPGIRRSNETQTRQGTFFYELTLDASLLSVGDILVAAEPEIGRRKVSFATTDQDAMVVASLTGLRSYLGARVNTTINLFSQSQAGTSDGNWDNTASNNLPVKLVNGSFLLGTKTEEPCDIPASIQPMVRLGGPPQAEDVPTSPKKLMYYAYVMPLPGFKINEGDRVQAADGARYNVMLASDRGVGTVGWEIVLEKQEGTM